MSTTIDLADRRAELETRAKKIADEIQGFIDRIDAGETLTDEQSERMTRQTAAVNKLLQGQIEEVRAGEDPRVRLEPGPRPVR